MGVIKKKTLYLPLFHSKQQHLWASSRFVRGLSFFLSFFFFYSDKGA